MRWLVIVALLAACAGDLGPPRPHPLPAPDEHLALLRPLPKPPEMLASYRIEAAFDPREHRVTGTAHLTWTNGGDSQVTALPFHLYMNAFKNDETVFMEESHGSMRGVEASPAHRGWIEVTSITTGGEELRARAHFSSPDETVLEVPLPRPVEPGATVEVDIAFTTQLGEVFARTGYKGAFHLVGQWFPKVGVRMGPPGAERWYCEPFHAFSEFFADFGTYDVTLTVPSTHVIAATGVLARSTDNGDGTYTLGYHAEAVHDFVFMADPYMEVISGTAKVEGGDVEVRVYHRPAQRDFAKRHLAAGIGAIETFSELFVPYPWPIMSIVDPPVDADGAAGMEYPTLVTTAGDGWYARDGVRLPEYVTIHEVGHNWFQGILASNEVDEAWMDEGVNEWADGEVIAKLYGERGGAIDWMDVVMDIDRLRRALTAPLGSIPSPIASASWAFVDDDAYGAATYLRTALALRTLQNLEGREDFLAAVKAYADEWQFRHPTGQDFFASVTKALGHPPDGLAWYWGPVFHGTGAPDYAVRTAECRPKREPAGVFGTGEERRTVVDAKETGAFECEVVIVNQGTIAVPVDIDLRFADGTVERKEWDHKGGAHWTRFEFDRSSQLVEVDIDPDGRVLLADDRLDDHLRLEPDGRASLRAAARISFWTQTMMQGLGL